MGVMDNGRSWTCTVYVYDIQFGNPAQTGSVTWVLTGTYPNTKIKNWKLTDTMAQNGDVAFGSTGSKALTLELADLASKDFGTGAIVGVVLGGAASGSWYFYADSVEWTANYGTTTRYSAKVTAYDTMYYAANRISSVNLPSPHYTDMIVNGKATVQDCRDIAQYCIRHARYDLIRERARELADDPTTTPSDKTRYETYANMVDSQYDEGYVPYTRTMDDVVSNAVGKVNIDAVGGYMQKITIDKTMTGRSLLGRMAAFMGMRAYCNNNVIGNIGKISFESLLGSSYNNDVPVDRKDVYDNGFVAEGKKSFKYFISGTTENPATAGKKTSNGYSTMVVNCPDMDSSRLNSLASGMAGKEYEIGKVKFRGDPALKAGMKVKFPDAGNNIHETVATKVVSNYDGGFYQTVYSEGKSDADIQFEQNRYAENATTAAEQKDPDAGGGGGGTTYIYYSESTTPPTATIDVGSYKTITSNSGITLEHTSTDDYFTINSTGLSLPGGFGHSITSKVNFGDNAMNPDLTYKHTTNVSVHGGFGARGISTGTLQTTTLGFSNEIGLISINSGTLYSPAYYWRLQAIGADLKLNTAASLPDLTFDFSRTGSAVTTIKTNRLIAAGTYDSYVEANKVYCSTFLSDMGTNPVQISLGGGAGLLFMYVDTDGIRFVQDTTNPDTTHTYTTIKMDLTATNINDLFTFSQS